jgi:signal transduction histidine kinase
MKTTRFIPIVLALTLIVGCAVLTNQTIQYKTLASVETTATAGFDGYLSAIAQGKVSTNSLHSIATHFNQLQGALKAATIAVAGNTNAVASVDISVSAAALANEIKNAK